MIPQPGQPGQSRPERKERPVKTRARSPSPGSQQYHTSFVLSPRPQSAATDFEAQGRLALKASPEDKVQEDPQDKSTDEKTPVSEKESEKEGDPEEAAAEATSLTQPEKEAKKEAETEAVKETVTEAVVEVVGEAAVEDVKETDTMDKSEPAGNKLGPAPSRESLSSLVLGASASASGDASRPTSLGGWSYASYSRARDLPSSRVPLPQSLYQRPSDLPSGPDLSARYMPAGTDAASLRSSFLQSVADVPSRLSYVPTGPVAPGDRSKSPNWCMSCPPNRLGFSAAMVAKKNLREPKADSRDYIGFATLPEQVHRKSVKRGFDFTLLVVGESGLGKSTLINSLFLGDLYKDRRVPDVAERLEKTTQIEKKSMDIEERGVKLRLTIVDTPGFGDGINCEESWRACVNYVDEQFRQYFTDENGLNRRNLQDNRVHCCLYFVPPYGHGLRQIDVEFMRRLHRKVNIVPVIAKADTLTAAEVAKLKRQILADIEENKVQIYQFPDCDSDEDDEFKSQDRELKACVPFAVVGSNTVLEVGGKKVRGRQYPWGVVEVENPKHSDFNKLRNMLITTHMQDLKDVTEDVHYENFRAQCISQISQQAIRERGKLKRDSGIGDSAISETDRLLLQKDEEIRRMQDMLTQMQEQLKQTGNKRDSVVNV